MKMAKKADVIVENFKSTVKHRLGIDYEAVKKINPRIVYGSISGFGQDGPYEGRPGVDQIAQGMGGLMSITGHPGQGPIRVGIAINDTSPASSWPTASPWRCSRASAPARGNGCTPRSSKRRSSCSTSRPRATR
jgi:crotonobetainyl-CoA:carnitine CoA-transferase CaiB-like acyl-CoA transferase